jgi:hypothetical protein
MKKIFRLRIWMGMTYSAWRRILAEEEVTIEPRYMLTAFLITWRSILNSAYALLENALYRKRIAKTRIEEEPVFIIGHWRSGTTLLHELLTLDERFTFPTTYQCFVPAHFLLTERIAGPLVGFFMPKTRPMDSVSLRYDKPQEDEFALCNLGVVSPYRGFILPRTLRRAARYQYLENLSSPERERWKQTFLYFLKKVTFRRKKRIVLKSPPHSFRIRVLVDMFPDARFIHIRRDPYTVYSSTKHFLISFLRDQGLQPPDESEIREFVLENYVALQRRIEKDRGVIPAKRLSELTYEELTAEPVLVLEQVYKELELGGFDMMRAKIAAFCEAHQRYRTSAYQLGDTEREVVTRAWARWIKAHGYTMQ